MKAVVGGLKPRQAFEIHFSDQHERTETRPGGLRSVMVKIERCAGAAGIRFIAL